jgi:hypothetical protein
MSFSAPSRAELTGRVEYGTGRLQQKPGSRLHSKALALLCKQEVTGSNPVAPLQAALDRDETRSALWIYIRAVRPLRWLAARARRRVGRAVHRAGGATRADIRHLHLELEQLRSELARLREGPEDSLAVLSRRLKAATDRAATLENLLAIEAVARFVRHARLRTRPLVSVVLPTYDRPDRLRHAIDSVVAQRYARWELLVVDDGGRLDSEAVVAEIGDPRVRWLRIDHQGPCAARNAALSCARGELIAYLDDDNVMDANWLYAVVWAFEQRPDIALLYGAIVVDDLLRVNKRSSGNLPQAFLNPWSRDALRHGNVADMGAIAHRSGLPEARFDESLVTLGDWDLLVRLTAGRDPLVLPAIACYYTTDAPDRLTAGPTQAADQAKVMARAAVSEE